MSQLYPPPVFISAPYGASTVHAVSCNVQRALCLARLARICGLAPIIPHPTGPVVYGRDENPRVRQQVMAACLVHVRMVADWRGELWVLAKEDGSLSAGCQEELDVFRQHWRSRSLTAPAIVRWRSDFTGGRVELSAANHKEWLLPWGGEVPPVNKRRTY